MRKITILIGLICSTAAMFLLGGCSSGENVDQLEISSFEEYTEPGNETGSQYVNLYPVELHKNEMEIAVFAFKGGEDGKEAVSGEQDGIELSHKLVTGDVETLLKDETKKIKEGKTEEDGLDEHYDYDDANTQFAVITYNLTDKENVYPCIEIARVEALSDGFCLVTHIKVDNTKTNENTEDVLKEIIAYMDLNLS